MNYQWYPGHMTKAVRQMQEDIKLIDLIIEVIDSRIPYSSRNPDIDKLAMNKSRVIIFNKADLADHKVNLMWKEYFEKQQIAVFETDSRNKNGFDKLNDMLRNACSQKLEKDKKKGIVGRPLRAMVVGIPNVGKSTFINSFAKKACTKTGNKPGVTKGKQWIKINKSLELLDTPGILWPKFDSDMVGEHLALVGSINDDILQKEELAYAAISFLKDKYPNVLKERYAENLDLDAKDYEILTNIALERKILMKGNAPDCERMAAILLDELRSGKLGRISLEMPDGVKSE